MTYNDLRSLDKRVKSIQDPFGNGFIYFYSIFKELSIETGTQKNILLHEYMDWKTYHL